MSVTLLTRYGLTRSTPAAGTGPDGTRYYVTVTIPSASITSTLTNFPVYLDLSLLPAGFWSRVQADGGDIRVTESDGTTRCPLEVVAVNTGSSTGEAHFLASSLSAVSDTTFRIYYDATTTLSQPAVGGTYGRNAVWTDYEAVWHLGEDPSGSMPQMLDSTGNSHSGTTGGSMASGDSISGQVGNALNFDGANDYVSFPDDAALDPTGDFTLSLWARFATAGSGVLYDKIAEGGGGGYRLIVSSGDARLDVDTGGSTTRVWGSGVGDGAWHRVSGKRSGSTGTLVTDTTVASNAIASGSMASASDANLARRPIAADLHWGGDIDEVRFRLSHVSDDWDTTEHANQDDPATFYTVGSEQAA